MTKCQKPQQVMTAEQAKQLAGQLNTIMHLIPDMALERLVEHLTGEMRRRGILRNSCDDDDVPF